VCGCLFVERLVRFDFGAVSVVRSLLTKRRFASITYYTYESFSFLFFLKKSQHDVCFHPLFLLFFRPVFAVFNERGVFVERVAFGSVFRHRAWGLHPGVFLVFFFFSA
ncbi:unnamed protein product, partial [Laminaria digitata]